MNIRGQLLCSRCLSEIDDESVCPYCGYDPEEIYGEYLLEEGTLLNHQRYHVGVVFYESPLDCWYGGWDYQKDMPVFIQEFFPVHLISRNITVSDLPVCQQGKEHEYKNALFQFLSSPGIILEGQTRIDSFEDSGFGYSVYSAHKQA